MGPEPGNAPKWAELPQSSSAVGEKIKRARQNLELLEHDVSGFLAGKPYQTTATWDSPTSLVVRFQILQAPPLRFGVLLGEFVHNLRSALDHLVWQLVLVSGGNPGGHSCFPIYTSHAGWRADVEDRDPNRHGKSALHGLVKGRAEIKAAQPFHGTHPRLDPLAVLRDLSNTDKHRVLVPGYMSLRDGELRLQSEIYEALRDRPSSSGGLRDAGSMRNSDEPLGDGEVLMTLIFPSPQDTLKSYQFVFAPGIAFGAIRPGLTFDRLSFIRERVAYVAGQLGRYLP